MLKFCANISWLFADLPFLERPDAARRAGFSGIEFHFPEGHSPQDIVRAANAAGVRIVLFNARSGDFLQGGPGYSGVPGAEADFRSAVAEARDFGAALGGARVQIGQSRVPPGISREDCTRVFASNLQHASAELKKAGCQVMIEPMNAVNFPGVLMQDAATALTLIEQLADPAIGLQFDFYHEHMAGADVLASLRTFAGRISHVQFSDAPGRNEPGTGSIDTARLFRELDRQEFPHWVSAEYRPSRPTAETLGWLTAYHPSHTSPA